MLWLVQGVFRYRKVFAIEAISQTHGAPIALYHITAHTPRTTVVLCAPACHVDGLDSHSRRAGVRCCPHTMWQTAAIALCSPSSIPGKRSMPPVQCPEWAPSAHFKVSLCRRRRRQHARWHADVSSRSARGHATEAVVAVCWRSRQRGRAARAVQTPHGSARRHVDHPESQHPESGACAREKKATAGTSLAFALD